MRTTFVSILKRSIVPGKLPLSTQTSQFNKKRGFSVAIKYEFLAQFVDTYWLEETDSKHVGSV